MKIRLILLPLLLRRCADNASRLECMRDYSKSQRCLLCDDGQMFAVYWYIVLWSVYCNPWCVVICAHAASRYCFWRRLSVCLSVCLFASSVHAKSWKLPIRNWCNLVGICPRVNARSWKYLTLTFDLESCFRTFFIQAICFEWLYLADSFSVWRYSFRISRSRFSFEVMSSRSRSRQWNSSSMQLNNYRSETAGAWSEYLLW